MILQDAKSASKIVLRC